MDVQGGCYCGAVRYRATGEALMRAQCHCRECQYITGGGPNVFMALPESGFSYTKAQPKVFRRKDLPNPVTREFCAECGTHLVSRAPGLPGAVILKVGTLDDPRQSGDQPGRFDSPDRIDGAVYISHVHTDNSSARGANRKGPIHQRQPAKDQRAKASWFLQQVRDCQETGERV